MAAMTLPAGIGGGSGVGIGQALQTSMSRAARLPPMNTFDEPVLILNHAGGIPQQVGARPMSSQRAAGMLLMRTRTLTPSITVPKLGSGVGGMGGGPLGGWVGCAWGVPRYGDMRVAAGRLGQTAASGAVRLANPTSNACLARPRPPITAPTVCCAARIARAVFSPFVGGRASGWPGFTGALMPPHAVLVCPKESAHCLPTPSIAAGVFPARSQGEDWSPVTPWTFWLTARRRLLKLDPSGGGDPAMVSASNC